MNRRHVVGIDLGTTHCALSYAEAGESADGGGSDGERHRVELLAVSQLVARATAEARPLLPSFLYLPHVSEGAQPLPWDGSRSYAVGEYARTRAADAPMRVVSSAKSWLSHAGIDRRAAVLPLGAPEEVTKVSPVEAAQRYLEHLRDAYEQHFGAADSGLRLADQHVVLTVPASFDAAARELTVEAAGRAGLANVTLLEEPQAAVYAWIEASGGSWRRKLTVGDVLLVVDVGGGTTDFSAIAAVDRDGSLELVRVAVGDHILLGGDNMDLALAHTVRAKIAETGKELDRWQMNALTHACRVAKERLLGDASVTSVPIVIAARGSQLLGGSIRSELSREEVVHTVLEGYFPTVGASARPAARARGGLTQLGLPYASDPAVTRHLAAFLGRQAQAVAKLEGFAPKTASSPTMLCPTTVLFNGGVMKGDMLRERIVATLNQWLAEVGAPAVRVLDAADLDCAVAKGAASYALARAGKGLRIRGGTARAYYVGIESPAPAVPGVEPPLSAMCVAPFGMEEGTGADLPPHELGVVVGEPVRFHFFGSSTRRTDVAGVLLETWKPGDLEELAPIEVTLPAEARQVGDFVPVRLKAQVTEIGTLDLEAVPLSPVVEGERWRVELNVRSREG